MISRFIGIGLGMASLVFGAGAFAQGMEATKTTFRMINYPLRPALAKISDVSGNPTVFVGEVKPEVLLTDEERVTMEAKGEAYWDVILKVCEKQKLKVVAPPENLRECLVLGSGEMGGYPRSMSGACMVRIERLRVLNRETFRESPSRSLHLDLALSVEPKLGMFKAARQAKIEEATTEGGESAIIPGDVNATFGDANSQTMHLFGVDLINKPGVKKLKTLKGSIWMIRALKSEEWTLEPAKADGKTFNCCDIDTVKIVKLALEGNAIMLDMEIESASNPGDSLLTKEYVFREMQYEFPEGTAEMLRVIDAHLTKEETVNGKWVQKFRIRNYYPNGEPAKMPLKASMRIPTEVKAEKVGFEFKDVEMP